MLLAAPFVAGVPLRLDPVHLGTDELERAGNGPNIILNPVAVVDEDPVVSFDGVVVLNPQGDWLEGSAHLNSESGEFRMARPDGASGNVEMVRAMLRHPDSGVAAAGFGWSHGFFVVGEDVDRDGEWRETVRIFIRAQVESIIIDKGSLGLELDRLVSLLRLLLPEKSSRSNALSPSAAQQPLAGCGQDTRPCDQVGGSQLVDLASPDKEKDESWMTTELCAEEECDGRGEDPVDVDARPELTRQCGGGGKQRMQRDGNEQPKLQFLLLSSKQLYKEDYVYIPGTAARGAGKIPLMQGEKECFSQGAGFWTDRAAERIQPFDEGYDKAQRRDRLSLLASGTPGARKLLVRGAFTGDGCWLQTRLQAFALPGKKMARDWTLAESPLRFGFKFADFSLKTSADNMHFFGEMLRSATLTVALQRKRRCDARVKTIRVRLTGDPLVGLERRGDRVLYKFDQGVTLEQVGLHKGDAKEESFASFPAFVVDPPPLVAAGLTHLAQLLQIDGADVVVDKLPKVLKMAAGDGKEHEYTFATPPMDDDTCVLDLTLLEQERQERRKAGSSNYDYYAGKDGPRGVLPETYLAAVGDAVPTIFFNVAGYSPARVGRVCTAYADMLIFQQQHLAARNVEDAPHLNFVDHAYWLSNEYSYKEKREIFEDARRAGYRTKEPRDPGMSWTDWELGAVCNTPLLFKATLFLSFSDNFEWVARDPHALPTDQDPRAFYILPEAEVAALFSASAAARRARQHLGYTFGDEIPQQGVEDPATRYAHEDRVELLPRDPPEHHGASGTPGAHADGTKDEDYEPDASNLQITVATANLFGGSDAFAFAQVGRHHQDKATRAQRFVDALSAVPSLPDAVFTQEAPTDMTLGQRLVATDKSVAYQLVYDGGRGQGEGMGLFLREGTRWAFDHERTINLATNPPSGCPTKRTNPLLSLYHQDVEGASVTVANLHLCGGGPDETQLGDEAVQAEKPPEKLKRISLEVLEPALKHGPAIVLGDFNSDVHVYQASKTGVDWEGMDWKDVNVGQLHHLRRKRWTDENVLLWNALPYQTLEAAGYTLAPPQLETSFYGGTPDTIWYDETRLVMRQFASTHLELQESRLESGLIELYDPLPPPPKPEELESAELKGKTPAQIAKLFRLIDGYRDIDAKDENLPTELAELSEESLDELTAHFAGIPVQRTRQKQGASDHHGVYATFEFRQWRGVRGEQETRRLHRPPQLSPAR